MGRGGLGSNSSIIYLVMGDDDGREGREGGREEWGWMSERGRGWRWGSRSGSRAGAGPGTGTGATWEGGQGLVWSDLTVIIEVISSLINP